jgi:D-tyrosyl-tRNA(Tyr) deacylase
VGISKDDKEEDIEKMVDKMCGLRLFSKNNDEEQARWQDSVKSLEYEVLLVSQFTLYGSLKVCAYSR